MTFKEYLQGRRIEKVVVTEEKFYEEGGDEEDYIRAITKIRLFLDDHSEVDIYGQMAGINDAGEPNLCIDFTRLSPENAKRLKRVGGGGK